MAQLNCVVVTPESTALEQPASFVVVPLYDGELGIAPGHSPLIGRLTFGELRIKSLDGQTFRYYVEGGFVQVNNNDVTVLTSQVVAAEKIDRQAAEEQLRNNAQRRATTEEQVEQRDRLVRQAQAQIRVAG